jgi:protocatechuate 3,4-dioxygenase beta subunit
MNAGIVSLKRRQFVVAVGLAGAAAAVPLLAAPAVGSPVAGKLIVSGRITGADGRALAGAVIEAWHAADRVSVTTDADGRFMFDTAASPRMQYRVNGAGREALHFARDGHLARDNEGVWRATFGLTVA